MKCALLCGCTVSIKYKKSSLLSRSPLCLFIENASVENDIEAERTEAFHNNENDACTMQGSSLFKKEFSSVIKGLLKL